MQARLVASLLYLAPAATSPTQRPGVYTEMISLRNSPMAELLLLWPYILFVLEQTARTFRGPVIEEESQGLRFGHYPANPLD